MIRKDTNSSRTRKEIRGCVDIGSSFFRLLVLEGVFPPWDAFRASRLEITNAHDDRRYVGWGEDVASSGTLTQASIARARDVLSYFISAAGNLGCRRPFLVATNTLREARNADRVIRELEDRVSLPISVLSQRDEARLAYIGSAAFSSGEGALVLFDVGGTSTEMSWGKGIEIEGYRGFPVGTHQTRLLCGPRFYSTAGMRRAIAVIQRCFENPPAGSSPAEGVSPLLLEPQNPTILLTGGTAVSCVLYLRFMRGTRPPFEEMYPLTLDDIMLLRRRLIGLSVAGRERLSPLDVNRMRLLPAGLVLVETMLRSFRIHSFNVTARDLRWGVAITGGG